MADGVGVHQLVPVGHMGETDEMITDESPQVVRGASYQRMDAERRAEHSGLVGGCWRPSSPVNAILTC